MTLRPSGTRPIGRWAVLGIAALLLTGVGVGAVLAAPPPGATTIPDNFFVVLDQQGANDVPGQVDLTQMGRDDTHLSTSGTSGYYSLFWSWDSIDQWTGTGQTGDACALFDSDGDTKINWVVCARVSNPNANPEDVELVPMDATHPVYLFSCSDAKNDRCTQPSAPLTYTSPTQVDAGVLTSLAKANLITSTDPFDSSAVNGPGTSYPYDTTVEVKIAQSVLPTPAAGKSVDLVNVCSYPSAGNGGNNNPFDCITNPGGGFLVIKKDAGVDVKAPTFSFTVTQGTSTTALATRSIAGTGTADSIGVPTTTSNSLLSVKEDPVPTNWDLKNVECAVEGSTAPVGTFDNANDRITGVSIASGKVTTCTFTDRLTVGTLIVKKVVVNDNGGTKVATDFKFKVNNGTATAFTQDGADTLKGQNTLTLPIGSYSVVEDATPIAGYTTTYDNCTDVAVTSGGSATCTITNNDQQGTLIVKKLVVNDNGGTKVATDFTFKVGSGTATAFTQDGADTLKGKNTISVDAGTYTVTEPAVTGYGTTYDKCTSVVIANGGTATCTITNDDQAATLIVTCTITNDDQAATLIVKKLVVNDNGGTKVATDFKFKVNGGTATAFTQDGADPLKGLNTLTVDAGTYSVVEDGTPIAGYTTTYDKCTSVVIANGGTATCTITNDDQKASPSGSTVQTWVLQDSIQITGLHDGASDQADARVTFRLYSDNSCSTQIGTDEATTIDATGKAFTATGVTVAATGFYYWRAEYSGDTFNNGFTTSCGSEVTQIQAKDALGTGRDDLIVK
jgi:hypothetical protein